VARREPTLRGGLLNAAPEWHQRDMTFDQARALGLVWIALLEDYRATAGLGAGVDITDEERPADGATGWLTRILEGWSSGGDDPRTPGLHALLPPIAEQIRSEPVVAGETFEMTWHLASDVDAIDLMLSLGIPRADPDPRGHRLELDRWAHTADRRDLRARRTAGAGSSAMPRESAAPGARPDRRRTIRHSPALRGDGLVKSRRRSGRPVRRVRR